MKMSVSENSNKAEIHGCLVCAKLFNILAIYTPDGTLVNCTVTSPGGRIVPDETHPLVACETHTPEAVESAYKRWQSMQGKGAVNEQEDE